MVYLKCPACKDMVPVPPEADAGEIVFVDDESLEAFVHVHHPHLSDDDYFEIIESAGDC